MPELSFYSRRTRPVLASNARNIRSLVPPTKTRSPAVASTEAKSCDFAKPWLHTFLPVAGSQRAESLCERLKR
jgi:hypothetical protein